MRGRFGMRDTGRQGTSKKERYQEERERERERERPKSTCIGN